MTRRNRLETRQARHRPFPSTAVAFEPNKAVIEDEQLRMAEFAVVCTALGAAECSLETSAVTRFLQLQCFTCRDEALAWSCRADARDSPV